MSTTMKRRPRARKAKPKMPSAENAFIKATKDSVREVIQEEVTPRLDNLENGLGVLDTDLRDLKSELTGIKSEAKQTNKLLQQMLDLQKKSPKP